MSDLEYYFREQDDDKCDHSLVRLVDSLPQRPEVKQVKVEVVRPRDVLGYQPAKLNLHLFDASCNEILPSQSEDWDDALNAALIRCGIRAVSLDNEMVRFSLALRAALQTPETRFGDGYYNGVLIHHLMNSPFARYPEVAEVLRHIHRPNIDPLFRTYFECRDMIDCAIRGCARELNHHLKYDISEAEPVLASALAQYFDERFSVTNRRIMGLL